jgi:hypothetical protein
MSFSIQVVDANPILRICSGKTPGTIGLLRKIGRLRPALPVMVVTAYGDEDRRRCLPCQAD